MAGGQNQRPQCPVDNPACVLDGTLNLQPSPVLRPLNGPGAQGLGDAVNELVHWVNKAREIYDEVKKRLEQFRSLLDEEERPATIGDLLLEWVPKLLDYVFEPKIPFAKQPFWKLYQPYFKILRELLVVEPIVAAADRRWKQAEEVSGQLADRADAVLRAFDFSNERWRRMQGAAEDLKKGMLDWRSAIDWYGPSFQLLPHYFKLRAVQTDVEKQMDKILTELFSHWASLEGWAIEIDRLMRERRERLDKLDHRTGPFNIPFGPISALASRHTHEEMADLSDVTRPLYDPSCGKNCRAQAPETRTAEAMAKVGKLVQQWVARVKLLGLRP